MKSKIKVLVLLIIVIITSVVFTNRASAQQTNVSFQVFYDQLSPYGEWVNYPNYGYVWIPDAGSDFIPYSTQGHWILTDFGWTWMSDYSWGWAPFHYGRWNYDHLYGWFWVPDNVWGPAWVSWRRADGYYGWAPMEPGISLSASFGRGYDSHNDHWIFVRDRDIDRADLNHYYISRTDQDQIVRRSSVINSTYVDSRRHTTYVTGPARADIQKVTGRQVNPVAIQDNNKPGQDLSNGQFRIYRPEVMENNDKEKKPAPSRITNLKDVKQPSERKVTNQQVKVNSTNNNKAGQQPNTVNPQKNSNNVKPLPPPNSNPPQNIKRERQPDNVKTLNTTPPPQNIKKQQPDNVKALNTTPPPQNIKREQQPNNVKTLNTNPSQNTGKEKHSNTAKSSKKNKKEQQKKSNAAEDIKKLE